MSEYFYPFIGKIAEFNIYVGQRLEYHNEQIKLHPLQSGSNRLLEENKSNNVANLFKTVGDEEAKIKQRKNIFYESASAAALHNFKPLFDVFGIEPLRDFPDTLITEEIYNAVKMQINMKIEGGNHPKPNRKLKLEKKNKKDKKGSK